MTSIKRPAPKFDWFVPIDGDGNHIGTVSAERPPTFEYLRQVVQAAEDTGYYSLLIPTRFSNGLFEETSPLAETWTTATALAAVTNKIRFLVAVRPGSVGRGVHEVHVVDFGPVGRAAKDGVAVVRCTVRAEVHGHVADDALGVLQVDDVVVARGGDRSIHHHGGGSVGPPQVQRLARVVDGDRHQQGVEGPRSERVGPGHQVDAVAGLGLVHRRVELAERGTGTAVGGELVAIGRDVPDGVHDGRVGEGAVASAHAGQDGSSGDEGLGGEGHSASDVGQSAHGRVGAHRDGLGEDGIPTDAHAGSDGRRSPDGGLLANACTRAHGDIGGDGDVGTDDRLGAIRGLTDGTESADLGAARHHRARCEVRVRAHHGETAQHGVGADLGVGTDDGRVGDHGVGTDGGVRSDRAGPPELHVAADGCGRADGTAASDDRARSERGACIDRDTGGQQDVVSQCDPIADPSVGADGHVGADADVGTHGGSCFQHGAWHQRCGSVHAGITEPVGVGVGLVGIGDTEAVVGVVVDPVTVTVGGERGHRTEERAGEQKAAEGHEVSPNRAAV